MTKTTDRKFIIKHYAGPVCYDVMHFLEKSKDTLHGDIASVMRDSGSVLMQQMFKPPVSAESASSAPSRRSKKKKGSDKKTLGTQFKEQLADLMIRLNKVQSEILF